jgi:hypothetical protein
MTIRNSILRLFNNSVGPKVPSKNEIADISAAYVHSCHRSLKEDWIFVVEFVRGGTSFVCFRNQEHFWELHLHMMNSYPEYNGEVGPRKIPFLDPPATQDMSKGESVARCQRLNNYLQQIIKLNVQSALTQPFFSMQERDYIDQKMSHTANLVEELLTVEPPNPKKLIKVYVGKTPHCWEQDEELTYGYLLETCQKLCPRMKKIYYKNEFREKVLLQSESELALLSYRRAKLVFIVSKDLPRLKSEHKSHDFSSSSLQFDTLSSNRTSSLYSSASASSEELQVVPEIH